MCGDGTCDGDENVHLCPLDCDKCGDGICSVFESHVTCFDDCFGNNNLPPQCSYFTPQSKMQAGIPVRDDTIGNLIANQVLWTIPGIEHLTHGFNIFTGKEQPAQIFALTYCSGDSTKTLQDTYRGNVYQVPYQV